jgi:hypothetical protein
LQHTWSLAIEEQFYLVWPLLILLALRARRARAMIVTIAAAGATASVLTSALLYRPDADPARVYYGTDARACALLTGCALAAVLTGRPGHRKRWVAQVGAVLAVAAPVVAWGHAAGADGWLYRGGLALVAVAVAAVLSHLVTAPGGIAARLLALAPLVALGRISYGVYLWHWPLFQLLNTGRTGLTGMSLFAVRIGVTLIVAAASFHLVEVPARRLRANWRSVGTAIAGPAVVTLAAVLLTTVPATGTTPAAAPSGSAPSGSAPSGSAPSGSAPSGSAPSGAAPSGAVHRRPGTPVRVDFFGDSVAWNLGAYLPVPDGMRITDRAIKGCGIAPSGPVRYSGGTHRNDCDGWDTTWRVAVDTDDPDLAVILLGRWEVHDREVDGRWQHVGEPQYDALLTRQLTRALDVVTARGARAVLLTTPYSRKDERPDGGLWPEDSPERIDAWNRVLTATAGRHPGHPVVLDLNAVACPQRRFTWSVNGVPLRGDGLHFTEAGVREIIAPWLVPSLVALAGGR